MELIIKGTPAEIAEFFAAMPELAGVAISQPVKVKKSIGGGKPAVTKVQADKPVKPEKAKPATKATKKVAKVKATKKAVKVEKPKAAKKVVKKVAKVKATKKAVKVEKPKAAKKVVKKVAKVKATKKAVKVEKPKAEKKATKKVVAKVKATKKAVKVEKPKAAKKVVKKVVKKATKKATKNPIVTGLVGKQLECIRSNKLAQKQTVAKVESKVVVETTTKVEKVKPAVSPKLIEAIQIQQELKYHTEVSRKQLVQKQVQAARQLLH